MASFDIFASSSTPQRLFSGEFGFIADTGALETEATAILSSGAALVAVMGLVDSATTTLVHGGGAFRLVVGDTGHVASDDTAINAAVDGGAFISNHGSIAAQRFGMIVGGSGLITILNSGSIASGEAGIADVSEEFARVVNDGTIKSSELSAVELRGDSLIINRGRMAGSFAGYLGSDGFDDVRNSGSIRGGVFTFDGADIITNSGFIDFAELGPGDDIVFNRGSIDSVLLGDGIDVYVGRRAGSAGFVDGGAGEDTLVGSRADDVFTGGADADVFEFAPRGGDDRILDFGDGNDEIDLTLFGFSSFREVRDRIEDRKRGALIDLSDGGQTIFLKDVEKADLGRSDFLLEL